MQQSFVHPLDSLTEQELTQVVRIIRESTHVSATVRFCSITLHEPSKEVVLSWQEGITAPREADVILIDQGRTCEALVSLTTERLKAFKLIVGMQAPISFEEVLECERAVKADLGFVQAIQRRGIENLDLVMVDSWPAGYYSEEDNVHRRLARPLLFVKHHEEDNGYAHPIEGLHIVVDLGTMQIVTLEDREVIAIPQETANYSPDVVGPLRQDLKPISIAQPEGPSFQVDGYQVSWQKWQFRVGFTPREGLVLHTVSYQDKKRARPILYRMSVAEMIVPYGDPSPHYYRRNVLDEGEHGLGVMANALMRGCDCLGEITYFDAVIVNGSGEIVRMPNAICLHEEDDGIIWKHTDFRTERVEVRRSRRLVVSFFATVGVYDYGFYWYFYQDGSIEAQVKLTGIMSTRGLAPDEPPTPRYGTLVAERLIAITHQHFFSYRMDMMVDGVNNSVHEVHLEAEDSANNPFGNAFFARETLLRTEKTAQQAIDPLAGRYWKIVNPSSLNAMGEPVAYRLLPGENTVAYASPEASFLQRAQFTKKNLWVTPFASGERFPAGDYPNQHQGGAGLPEWTQGDRSIENTNLVLWYTLGVNHVPRLEDWPVMPVKRVGFHLQPSGFFDRNPALDVPLPPGHQGGSCTC